MVATVQHIEVKGKTEQRVIAVIAALKDAQAPVTYKDLQNETGTAYDVLLYILATLVEVGLVSRSDEADGPGRPKVRFTWTGKSARVGGTRLLAS